jgi:hypothetical protein
MLASENAIEKYLTLLWDEETAETYRTIDNLSRGRPNAIAQVDCDVSFTCYFKYIGRVYPKVAGAGVNCQEEICRN